MGARCQPPSLTPGCALPNPPLPTPQPGPAAWGSQVGLHLVYRLGDLLKPLSCPSPSRPARALLRSWGLCRPQSQSEGSAPCSLPPQRQMCMLSWVKDQVPSTWIAPFLVDGDSRRMGSSGGGAEGLTVKIRIGEMQNVR